MKQIKKLVRLLAMITFAFAITFVCACTPSETSQTTPSAGASTTSSATTTENTVSPILQELYEQYVEHADENGEIPFSYDTWIAILKGEKGTGTSAYETWLTLGHEGSGEDFLLWLKTIGDAHEHSYAEWVSLSKTENCAEKIYFRFCNDCGQVAMRQGQDTDHTLSNEYVGNEVVHWLECDTCGEQVSMAPHEGGEANCTQKAECAICGNTYGDFAHSYDTVAYDENYHWCTCSCGSAAFQERHTFAPYEEGFICTVCFLQTDKTNLYTYNTYTDVFPLSWNPLTTIDGSAAQIMHYLESPFFIYDYPLDAEGRIIPGDYVVKYSAATALEDVTALYASDFGLTSHASGLAWKITLRNDLTWENGDSINAYDFVYSMQELLNPHFMNSRGLEYLSGELGIVNADKYYYQNTVLYYDNQAYHQYGMADLTKGTDGQYVTAEGYRMYIGIDFGLSWLNGNTLADYVDTFKESYFGNLQNFDKLKKAMNHKGVVPLTDETLALLSSVTTSNPAWDETDAELSQYFVEGFTSDGSYAWENVGIFATGPCEIVLVLKNPLNLLKEDGSLSYRAASVLACLPLVHKATYEASKIAPSAEGDMWTSIYGSSVETTMSWGPYSLHHLQADSEYTLVKNKNWFGYPLEENKGFYQTDKIICKHIAKYQDAFSAFLKGEIDHIDVHFTDADLYENSERAYFTPQEYVMFVALQSNQEALKGRETPGVDKEILADVNFRKALALAINRDLFPPRRMDSFSLFSLIHYYDVENGKLYGESEEVKRMLCAFYGVNPDNFGGNLDAAFDAITGYDIEAARELVIEAYNDALAAGTISETDKVVLSIGYNSWNQNFDEQLLLLNASWSDLMFGTPLDGRFEVRIGYYEDIMFTEDFREGEYDIMIGGKGGFSWNPATLLWSYLDPDHMLSATWDTYSQMMTFTMKGVGENGEDITETMSLMDWLLCLGGDANAKYDWSSNALSEEQRLPLIVRLEEEVLKTYYTIPLYNAYSTSLISYKIEFGSYTYNTFMGFGGIKYVTYNYSDVDWHEAVVGAGGKLYY